MSYITEIFERLDIQHIREFLLHGVEETEVDTRSYMERLKTPEKIMTSFLHSKFPNEEEYEGITDKVYDYASACQNVYMEIGLQGGFILSMQINLEQFMVQEGKMYSKDTRDQWLTRMKDELPRQRCAVWEQYAYQLEEMDATGTVPDRRVPWDAVIAIWMRKR